MLLVPLFLVAVPPIHSQQLLLTPIGGCSNSIGRLRVSWNAPDAAVSVCVGGKAAGATTAYGLRCAAGIDRNGDWVREGLPVTLSSESGQILASGNAALDCEESRDWIPLKVGNRWIYRSNTRQITATHFARTIVRTVEVEGFTYYVARQSRNAAARGHRRAHLSAPCGPRPIITGSERRAIRAGSTANRRPV